MSSNSPYPVIFNHNEHPFGLESAEKELSRYKESYEQLYFEHVPFSNESLESETYIIIGRRGSGKTSLSQYFSFHNNKHLKRSRCIDVDEPKVYQKVIKEYNDNSLSNVTLDIDNLVEIWEYIFWMLLFNEYSDVDPLLKSAVKFTDGPKSPIQLICDVLAALLTKFTQDKSIANTIKNMMAQNDFMEAKSRVIELTKRQPAIIAMDTLERYDVNDEALMISVASLIQCGNKFNDEYVKYGIHLKILVSAEIFPYVEAAAISNTTKYIRNKVYLNWRPKDLVRLLCWRFHHYLVQKGCRKPIDIDWDSFSQVYESMWKPYFKEKLINRLNIKEETLPYILRHTQMRPRQLVILCNTIHKLCHGDACWPEFSGEYIIKAVRETELILANEVLNSYSHIYHNVSEIITALMRSPLRFKGNHLDKISKETASAWPAGNYSQLRFRRLVAELGIVGTVRKIDKGTSIIPADFQYNMQEPISINTNDECVVHPMFLKKLSIKNEDNHLVYPFPDGKSYFPEVL